MLLLIVLSTESRAQLESEIIVAGDPTGVLCTIRDTGPELKSLYVLHSYNVGMVASRFRIQSGPGVTMTYVSETHFFPETVGDTQTGISVCYGECTTGDLLIAKMDYLAFGTSDNCSQMLVVPHPDAQSVEAIKCTGTPTRAFVQDMFVRSTGPCGCPDPHGFPGQAQLFGCKPIPVATTTWGAIKALYAR
jgi:hypothetical protein